MKSFTDLEQSKKLAEILPPQSADMFWLVVGGTPRVHVLTDSLSNYSKWENYPCWSLAALLDVIPWGQVNRMTNSSKWAAVSWKDSNFVPKYPCVEGFDTPIDACYELILKLHEHKLI